MFLTAVTRLPGFRSDGGVDTGALTEEQESGADGGLRRKRSQLLLLL